jgi:hypothetical protein
MNADTEFNLHQARSTSAKDAGIRLDATGAPTITAHETIDLAEQILRHMEAIATLREAAGKRGVVAVR